jgi:hypothetical protein
MSRDEFTRPEKRRLLELNAGDVLRRWPTDFRNRPPHYICENCGFVSDERNFFEIDHIWACANGGTSNRIVATPELARRLAAGDLEATCEHGVNAQVLCRGCNQAKKAKQFVSDGAGYAYRHHEWDRNPDHLYADPPK